MFKKIEYRMRHEDEMCIFYLMYYTDFEGIVEDFQCAKYNSFLWSRDLPLSKGK